MTDLAVSPALLIPTPVVPTPAQLANTARMKKTAEAFEVSFLSQMMKPMFEGLSTKGDFTGGEAESTWRSFIIDAMAQQTVKAGGIGLTQTVMAQMIKMQEAHS